MDGIAMTAEELQSLRSELNELESDGRAQIAQRIKTAREWGDLKENGEYHAAKEAQAHLETRIARLRGQVRGAVVIESTNSSDVVGHGSTIICTDGDTQTQQTFRIVSAHDAKPSEGQLSATSPIAKALIGARVGDVVEVKTPRGTRRLTVDTIS
jgi:transcription elongation factor GreA